MTIRQLMEKELTDHGLWPDEASAIMDTMEDEKIAESMQDRWNHDADGYPPEMMPVTWMTVKHVAGKWLEANKPSHWALPMFLHNADVEARRK